MPSKRAVSEVLRRACVGDYETVGDAETNAQEIMESCHELLAIVEAAKAVTKYPDGVLAYTSMQVLIGALRAAGEEIE